MATLAQIRNKADSKLQDFWILLKEKQGIYFEKHGKYFQMLISPTNIIIDGLDSDYVNRVPSDELHIVDREFTFAEKVPFQIEVHEWMGPNNDVGYKAKVWIQLFDGRIFVRNRDSNQNDSGWFEYIDNEN